jgi:hypothetical protein
MAEHDYEAGLRDGKLDSLEKTVKEHKIETKTEFERLWSIQKSQERVIWMMIGAFGLMQFLPKLQALL